MWVNSRCTHLKKVNLDLLLPPPPLPLSPPRLPSPLHHSAHLLPFLLNTFINYSNFLWIPSPIACSFSRCQNQLPLYPLLPLIKWILLKYSWVVALLHQSRREICLRLHFDIWRPSSICTSSIQIIIYYVFYPNNNILCLHNSHRVTVIGPRNSYRYKLTPLDVHTNWPHRS